MKTHTTKQTNMKFKSFKPGDLVFVVPQQRRYAAPVVPFTAPITKMGKKYGYIARFSNDLPFNLETGCSHHTDSNARSNGFGFDVYLDEAEYHNEIIKEQEHKRLADRLIKYPNRLIDMSQECVQKMHQVLDEHKEGKP